jgi:hypothetical protein
MKQLFWLFLLAACSSAPSSAPKSSKEAAMSYVNALQKGECSKALEETGGALRTSYEQMIKTKGLDEACSLWRLSFLSTTNVEYGYEEKKGKQTLAWVKVFRNKLSFAPMKLEMGQENGTWKVIGL